MGTSAERIEDNAGGQIAESIAIYRGIPGRCMACGLSYQAYHGHLGPCPRCALHEAIAAIHELLRLLPSTWFTFTTPLGRAMRRCHEISRLR